MRYRVALLLFLSTGMFLLCNVQDWFAWTRLQVEGLLFPGRSLVHQASSDRAAAGEPVMTAQTGLAEPAATSPAPSIREEPINIPSYPYEAYLHDVYTPTLRTTFTKLDWDAYEQSTLPLANRQLTAVVLENVFLKLTVLPELGGRIYSCVFKPTGHNEFYQNPVLKPTRWGPVEQGWWLAAGGMEWCFPVDEHGYETAVPWRYHTLQTSAGVTATVWSEPSAQHLTVQVDVHLPNGRSYFAVTPHVRNSTDRALDYKFWINAMLSPGGTNAPSGLLQLIFPTDQMTVHSRDVRWNALPQPGEPMDWPVRGGVDLSLLGNWPHYLGCFERPAAVNGFMGAYDGAVEEGIVRVFPGGTARGAKAFAFGYGDGALKPELWTDDGSSYVEIHGGVAPTFADYATLAPHSELTWTEFWYPVAAIGGVVAANSDAALNLERAADGIHVGVATTSNRSDLVLAVRRRADNSLVQCDVIPRIGPARPFLVGPIPSQGIDPADLAVVLTAGNGQTILSY